MSSGRGSRPRVTDGKRRDGLPRPVQGSGRAPSGVKAATPSARAAGSPQGQAAARPGVRLDAETRGLLKALIDARRREITRELVPPPIHRSEPGRKVDLPQVGSRGLGGVRTAQHGTEAAYRRYGCRCEECREAVRVGRALRRAKAERRCGFCGERRCIEHADLEEQVA